ncbi:hypothetical protein OROHE_005251 [Orobanche hederae]
MYNKRLTSRWLKKTYLKEDEDPLVLDEIPPGDEWMIDKNGSNNSGSILTDNIGDVDGGDNEHVREVNEDGGRGRVDGRTCDRGIGGCGRGQGREKRDIKERGYNYWMKSSLLNPMILNDAMVELFDDDGDDGGDTCGFDPCFKPLDTDDPILNSS